MYEPKPMDTGPVKLPPELTERIAENVHEVWATGRTREGIILQKHRLVS